MPIYKAVALLFVGLLFPVYGISQDSSPTQVTELTEGLYRIQIDAGAWITNMVAFVGKDGLLLVDSGEKEFLESITEELKKLFPGDPTYILNTHAHVDHTGEMQWTKISTP
jgi:glyoxylase-like metal-dependent hydrolase (beta-lactamase superfamily II)